MLRTPAWSFLFAMWCAFETEGDVYTSDLFHMRLKSVLKLNSSQMTGDKHSDQLKIVFILMPKEEFH